MNYMTKKILFTLLLSVILSGCTIKQTEEIDIQNIDQQKEQDSPTNTLSDIFTEEDDETIEEFKAILDELLEETK